ncbi:hypothetical protein Ddc_15187 [Ditylenchus destructor]|nr:hypothetical protein Ddc_15187 [Ditylenchus destructor]
MAIFQHFSRKELCRLIYPVNRKFYNLAKFYVPVVHLIDELVFEGTESCIVRHRTFFRKYMKFPAKQIYGYHVRIESAHGNRRITTKELLKISTPGPLIRFRQVSINRYQEEPILNFLIDARDSFVGCRVGISFANIEFNYLLFCYNPKTRGQVKYLLKNVFQAQSRMEIFDTTFFNPEWVLKVESIWKCRKLCLHFNRSTICDHYTNCALMNWLSNAVNCNGARNYRNLGNGRKHLKLVNYPFILDMVKRLKQDFKEALEPSSEYMVTFAQGYIYLCLESDLEFSFVNKATGEQLTFLKHGNNTYRLWRATN